MCKKNDNVLETLWPAAFWAWELHRPLWRRRFHADPLSREVQWAPRHPPCPSDGPLGFDAVILALSVAFIHSTAKARATKCSARRKCPLEIPRDATLTMAAKRCHTSKNARGGDNEVSLGERAKKNSTTQVPDNAGEFNSLQVNLILGI